MPHQTAWSSRYFDVEDQPRCPRQRSRVVRGPLGPEVSFEHGRVEGREVTAEIGQVHLAAAEYGLDRGGEGERVA
jgi:hypothetical protein